MIIRIKEDLESKPKAYIYILKIKGEFMTSSPNTIITHQIKKSQKVN
jgi:hypothetical protein